MALLRSHKGKFVLAVVVLGTLLAWFSVRETGDSPPVPSDKQDNSASRARKATSKAAASFDFYLLALTAHAAFCADGNEGKRECRSGPHRPLVIHGLWPERLQPRTYPHDCPAPRLELDPGLEMQLAEFMPGMADGLHVHEWREHGGCSGLDDDEYFSRTLDLARALDAALGARLTTLAGRETSPAELRETADMFQPGIAATFTLHCRTLRDSGGRPVLIEVRQCIDDDGLNRAPGKLLDCASVGRRDQGCGSSFEVAGERR